MTDLFTARICYKIFVMNLNLKNEEYLPSCEDIEDMDSYQLKSSLQINYMIYLSESVISPTNSSTSYQYNHLIKIINKCIDGFYEGALEDCQQKYKQLEKENTILKEQLNQTNIVTNDKTAQKSSWF